MFEIYAIQHIDSGDSYVGCTSQLARRWRTHRQALVAGTHYNAPLQAAWNLYGQAAFGFIVLESSTKAESRAAELRWIDKLGAYNLQIADEDHFTTREEAKRNSSERQSERWQDPNVAAGLRQTFKSETFRANAAENLSQRWKDGEPALIAGNIKALKAAHMGHSERLKARWRDDPEYAAKMIAVSKAVLTPEHQKAAIEKRWAQEGAREQQSAKLTEAWNTREKKSGLPRGVSHLKDGRFKASLWKDGKTKHIGCYDTIEEAAAAYQLAIAG